MEVIYERCCGLDVHKKNVVACVMITPPNGRVKKSVRTFGTTTSDILDLCDWIDEMQVSHVALESTGIFWRPLYNIRDRRTYGSSCEPSPYQNSAGSQDGRERQ